jgi:hypothetical protein
MIIGLDSLCSRHLFSDLSDFLSDLIPITPFEIHGVGGNIKPISKGSVRLRFWDSTGAINDKLLSNVYYAPKCPVRLISIPQLARDTNGCSSLCTGGSQSVFTWAGDATTVAHTSPSGVPFLQAYVGNPPHQALYSICNLAHNSLSTLSASTMTSSPSPNSDGQDIADLGQVPHLATLPPSEDITLGKLPIRFNDCTPPICSACLFAKQTRRQCVMKLLIS